jgi:hypothetical protein
MPSSGSSAISTPAGSNAWSVRRMAVLLDAFRRLPEMPASLIVFMGLSFLVG